MAGIKLPKLPKTFEDIEKEIKTLEELTEKVIERLPELKKELTAYDDKSNEIYNMDVEQVRLFTKAYEMELNQTKSTSVGLERWIGQLKQYGMGNIGDIIANVTNKRIEEFKESMQEWAYSDEEIEYVNSLLDKMDDKLKYKFTRSKFFWAIPYNPSVGIEEFRELYQMSPATAKLEEFLEKEGIETENKYTLMKDLLELKGKI